MVYTVTFSDWQTWVFLGAIGFIALDHFRLRSEVGVAKVELANLRTHVAENYVRSPEVTRLSEEIAAMRHSFDEGMKVIYELRGALGHKAGG